MFDYLSGLLLHKSLDDAGERNIYLANGSKEKQGYEGKILIMHIRYKDMNFQYEKG